MSKQYKFVDLFAGCGGLSLGLQQAGFTPWFVNEIVEQFCNTYKINHNLSDEHYFVGDIAELNLHLDEYKEILSDITLVCGGPPCQGFSMANRQRILDDPRNALYRQYLIFLKNIRPKFFIMENVKGMMNKIEEIKQNFEEYLGDEYQYDYALLKAQDYGVPQNRERFIMIGNRVGVEPKSIFEEIFKHKHKPFVLKDALEGLPHLIAKKEKGSKGVECAESGFTECDFSYIRNDFYKFINGDREITKLYNHKNRYNNERDIEIYRRLPQGANSLHESIADIMPYKRRNDVFKDYEFGDAIFNDEDGSKLSFDKFYTSVGMKSEIVVEKVGLFLQNLGVVPIEESDNDFESDIEEDKDESESTDGKIRLTVKFPDGAIISGKTKFDSYIEALKKIGLDKAEKIASEKKYHRLDCALISKVEEQGILNATDYSYVEEQGFYIVKGINGKTMRNMLKLLSQQLNLQLEISYE